MSTHYQQIKAELTKISFEQLPIGLFGESIAALSAALGIWNEVSHVWLLSWLICNLLLCGLARHVLVFLYKKKFLQQKISSKNVQKWLILFGIGAFISGISWGVLGSLLMPKDLLHQTFVIFVLIGITSAANLFYSPIKYMYAIFLLPAFLPFVLWLLLQGGIFMLLSCLALVYMIIMLLTSSYAHRVLVTTLALGFEKTDLVENLMSAKETLEARTQALEKSLSLLRATQEATTDGILVVNSDFKIEDYNGKFLDMWEINTENLQRKSIDSLSLYIKSLLDNPDVFVKKIAFMPKNANTETFDELFFKDGRVFEQYSSAQKIGKKCVGRVFTFRDVTTRKTLEARIFQQTNFDVLTGLPNRNLLLDRIAQAINYAKILEKNLALCFINIDRFKLINETLGHAFGDLLLTAVAKRLTNEIHKNDTVARVGSDEFVIILNGLDKETNAISTANMILESIQQPFMINNEKIKITLSIGISFFPKDGSDPEMLISKADIAMYHAKELGRNNFQFFMADMNKKMLERLMIENQLRDAVAHNEFMLLYQPIVSLKTGKITGLEALLRWRNPQLMSISTLEFINVAEESGIIIPIGQWVLETACLQIKKLQMQGFNDLHMAVNVSARQFKQPEFAELVDDILRKTQLEPRYLAIEITESVIMDELQKTVNVIRKLKHMGIKIVIDDFGTGYSSLNYLKNLPVDKLKIDRTFIQEVPQNSDDAAITAAIIVLAEKLKLGVIVEGVENDEQLEFLIAHRCDEIQGFYFSEPVEPQECLILLKHNQKSPIHIKQKV